jgi:hypothetical protein
MQATSMATLRGFYACAPQKSRALAAEASEKDLQKNGVPLLQNQLQRIALSRTFHLLELDSPCC